MRKQTQCLINIIKNDYRDKITFLHNTRVEETALRILHEGFIFENQLSFTSDRVNPTDEVELNYFFSIRKDYGFYTIVVQISRKQFEMVHIRIRDTDLIYEDIITKTKPVLNENDEMQYTLPEQYIKGFWDQRHKVFHPNTLFHPSYLSEQALQKLEAL